MPAYNSSFLTKVIPADDVIISQVAKVYAAHGAISGHRVVRPFFDNKIVYADCNILADANNVIGISTNAAIDGDAVNVVSQGTIEEPTWAWTPDAPVFLGSNGTLTQVVPASGFNLIVAIATSPTTLLVDIKQPIIL